jgi:hypothetical protein
MAYMAEVRPDDDGGYQLSLLDAAWDQAAQHWQDEMARDFDRHHWTPLRQEFRSYLDALARLREVLAAAERDTEF